MALTDIARTAAAADLVEPTPGQLLRRRIFGHAGLIVGGTVLAIIVLVAIFAPWIAPHDPYDQVLSRKLIPPVWYDDPKASWDHILGTDALGRDYLSRLIFGARISLLIGFTAMLISGVIGTTIGVLAGYFGGRVDMVANFIITTRLSLPVVLVALAVVSLIGSSLRSSIWVLGLLIWDRFAVVMRSATMQVRDLDFVASARALGCSTPRILLTEIMPNIVNSLIVVATVEMAHAIILEAALSFLGMGVQPPDAELGADDLRGASGMIFFEAWLIMIPGARALHAWCWRSTCWATASATSPRPTGGAERVTPRAHPRGRGAERRHPRRRRACCTRCRTSRSMSTAARRWPSSASPAAASR